VFLLFWGGVKRSGVGHVGQPRIMSIWTKKKGSGARGRQRAQTPGGGGGGKIVNSCANS
jgi:hypothetical protein